MSDLRDYLLAANDTLDIAIDDAKTEENGHAERWLRKAQAALSKTVAFYDVNDPGPK